MLTPNRIDAILLKVGTTGVKQVWFQRQEVKDAVKAAYEAGRNAGPAIHHVECHDQGIEAEVDSLMGL